MRAKLTGKVARTRIHRSPSTRFIALVVASVETHLLIGRQLLEHGMEVHAARHYGAMAAKLFDDPLPYKAESPFLFVLDLRLVCGLPTVERRLSDYDTVLHAYMIAGYPWPKTLCLVNAEQTRPAWLHDHPNFQATLLADEVETVIGNPQENNWEQLFDIALNRCFLDSKQST